LTTREGVLGICISRLFSPTLKLEMSVILAGVTVGSCTLVLLLCATLVPNMFSDVSGFYDAVMQDVEQFRARTDELLVSIARLKSEQSELALATPQQLVPEFAFFEQSRSKRQSPKCSEWSAFG